MGGFFPLQTLVPSHTCMGAGGWGPPSVKLLFILHSFILVFKDTAFPFLTQPDVSVYH